jgi:hypothetical protein
MGQGRKVKEAVQEEEWAHAARGPRRGLEPARVQEPEVASGQVKVGRRFNVRIKIILRGD